MGLMHKSLGKKQPESVSVSKGNKSPKSAQQDCLRFHGFWHRERRILTKGFLNKISHLADL